LGVFAARFQDSHQLASLFNRNVRGSSIEQHIGDVLVKVAVFFLYLDFLIDPGKAILVVITSTRRRAFGHFQRGGFGRVLVSQVIRLL
jgi:hypothetical protein